MSRDQRRYLLAIGLLIVAVGAAFLIVRRDRLTAPSGGYEFVTDVDNWQRTERERAVSSPYNFNLAADLNETPLQIGDWTGVDAPQTNLEVFILLEPEQYVQRIYTLPDGRFVYLSLIGSRKSKSFHSPQICYDTDGWQTEAGSEAIALAEGDIYALRLVADKMIAPSVDYQHIVQYLYLWPAYARNPQEGMVLVKLTAPVFESVEDTIALEKDFFRLLFTAARN